MITIQLTEKEHALLVAMLSRLSTILNVHRWPLNREQQNVIYKIRAQGNIDDEQRGQGTVA